jgi:hypothetical protein
LSRNLGDLVFSTLKGGAGAAVVSRPGPGSCLAPGSEEGQRVVPPSEGNEARRDGEREVGVHW